MKKKFFLSICMAMIATFAAQAQYISNHIIAHPQCLMMSYQYNISKADSNLSVKTYFGDGRDTTVYLSPTQDHQHFYYYYNARGTYTVKSELYKNGTPIHSVTAKHEVFCEYVMLHSYMDDNNNCVQDYGEYHTIDSIMVEVDSAGVITDTVNFNGVLTYKTAPNTTYKFRQLTLPLGADHTCPSNGVVTVTTPTTGFAGYVSFGHKCSNTNVFDFGVRMSGRFRPVATSLINIQPYNKGCGTKTATVTLNLSPKYKYNTATPTPTSVNGQIITWTINNLTNRSHSFITLTLDTATSVSLNDTICNTVTITPISGDTNTANNVLTTCDNVVTSWDPNDKHVKPAGDIAPGTKLTYTINFENLGSDTAFNIHILDTLSEHVDPSTIQVLSASHTMMKEFVDNNIGKTIVKFDFPDIRLADSNSKQHNKGFVTFSIMTKSNLAYYTQINNRAGIYFDINPVVFTNYTNNRIAPPQSVVQTTANPGFTAYPNPVSQTLNVQVTVGRYDALKMYNAMGQVVAQQKIIDGVTTINMAHLPAGIYYLQLTGKNNTVTRKIVKN